MTLKQALYGELSKPNRIGHSICHKVQKLVPDGNSKFAMVGIIAEWVIRVLGSYMCVRGF